MSWFMRLITIILCGLAPFVFVDSSEETQLLKEVANQYSPSMAVAFLHERIRVNKENAELIKKSLTNLDELSCSALDLAAKSLSILDQHLTALEKADYFDYNGTEKIKTFIEQFTTNIEMFPVHVDSQKRPKVEYRIDQILSAANVTSNDVLINRTQALIATYIRDLEEKENNEDNNRVQKLSAALTKTKLQQLADYSYSKPPARDSRCNEYRSYSSYRHIDCSVTVDTRQNEIKKLLNRLKPIVNLFYGKFTQLADPNKPKRPTIIKKAMTESELSFLMHTAPFDHPLELSTMDYRQLPPIFLDELNNKRN